MLGTGLIGFVAASVAAVVLTAWLVLTADGFSVVAWTLLTVVLVVFVVAVVDPVPSRVPNTAFEVWLVLLVSTPVISPLVLRKLGMVEFVVSVVVLPTSTLTKSFAVLAGVSNVLMALVRSVLVALAFRPKAKANCFCCAGVRPDTENVGEKDCNRLIAS